MRARLSRSQANSSTPPNLAVSISDPTVAHRFALPALPARKLLLRPGLIGRIVCSTGLLYRVSAGHRVNASRSPPPAAYAPAGAKATDPARPAEPRSVAVAVAVAGARDAARPEAGRGSSPRSCRARRSASASSGLARSVEARQRPFQRLPRLLQRDYPRVGRPVDQLVRQVRTVFRIAKRPPLQPPFTAAAVAFSSASSRAARTIRVEATVAFIVKGAGVHLKAALGNALPS